MEKQRAAEQTRRAVIQRAQEMVVDFDTSWDGLSMKQRREVIQSVVESASMSRLPDGRTEVTFTIRGFEPVTRHIGRRRRRDHPSAGLESLTAREQALLYHFGHGLDRYAIAKKVGTGWDNVNHLLWKARKKLGVETLAQAWKMARDYIEANLHWLPLEGRTRKAHPERSDAPLLTEAHVQLLSLLAKGISIKEASAQLGMKGSTPYVHLKNCRDRLGTASIDETVRKAIELGYVAL